MVFSGVVNYTEVISTEIGAAEGAVGQLFLPELEKISLVRKNTTQQFTIKEFLLDQTSLHILKFPRNRPMIWKRDLYVDRGKHALLSWKYFEWIITETIIEFDFWMIHVEN